MKKCNRCQVVFHDLERLECLYCDTTLQMVTTDDSVAFQEDKNFDVNLAGGGINRETPVLKELLRDWQLSEYLRVQYMVGSYFKVRTFKFMYSFSRNHFRMGKGFKRMLAQPLNITSLLMIPWVMIDLVDTLYIRLSYNAYCLRCGWKFRQVHATQEHDPVECEYNQEYTRVVNDIVSGNIAKTEGLIKQEAYKKIQAGKQSAYRDLCLRRRSGAGWMMDVFCIWFSIMLVLALAVTLTLPFILSMATWLQSGE